MFIRIFLGDVKGVNAFRGWGESAQVWFTFKVSKIEKERELDRKRKRKARERETKRVHLINFATSTVASQSLDKLGPKVLLFVYLYTDIIVNLIKIKHNKW